MSAATSTTVTLSYFWNISRMCLTMTPSWTSVLTQPTGSPWRDTSTRGPATPSRPGAGTSLPTTCLAQNSCIVFFFVFFTPFLPPNISLRETQTSTVLGNSFDSVCGDFPLSVFPFFADWWLILWPFSCSPPAAGVGFRFRKISWCIRRNSRYILK